MMATATTSGRANGRPESRFEFGENWSRFLEVLDEARIEEAERSLRSMLECESLEGLSFVDIGSGSGLFSLAAFRLGAERIHSLDLDPASVACTAALKRRYAGDAPNWTVERASALDREHISSLGEFDVVYSWGVLHHTGDMLSALDNAALPVARGGRLFIAIYNDQGAVSRRWLAIKRLYNRMPRWMRPVYVATVMAPFELRSAVSATLRLRPWSYAKKWTEYRRNRGMSRWHNMVDWVGGYPFEVASPEMSFDFYRPRGFSLVRLVTRPGQNEFVFQRDH